MSDRSAKGFAAKHGEGASADPRIRDAVASKSKDGRLACAVAFAIADALSVSPADVGRTVDIMDYRLTHCQLGLFGYAPEKKIVTPAETVPADLAAALRAELVDDRLPCRAAWVLAEKMQLGKRTVSGACEALGIKIKPCQLGAF